MNIDVLLNPYKSFKVLSVDPLLITTNSNG